MFYIYTRNSYT